MQTRQPSANRTVTILLSIVLWAATCLAGLGIGVVGVAKFGNAAEWKRLFIGWGYPAWMSFVIGVAELLGAVALFIPRIALAGVCILGTVMTGALFTLLLHHGGPMGWGATPAIHLALLSVIAAIRWSRRTRVDLSENRQDQLLG